MIFPIYEEFHNHKKIYASVLMHRLKKIMDFMLDVIKKVVDNQRIANSNKVNYVEEKGRSQQLNIVSLTNQSTMLKG